MYAHTQFPGQNLLYKVHNPEESPFKRIEGNVTRLKPEGGIKEYFPMFVQMLVTVLC